MKYEEIILDREEAYAVVKLDHPSELNALTRRMRIELEECFNELEKDDEVRAVILTGGDYVFCAGLDIKELAALPDGEIEDYFRTGHKYLQKIYTFRKPVIAAVGGIALGGGFNLAVVCDLIVASERAIFGHPEMKFGLSPLFDPLQRIVGVAKAKEIAMLGEPIGANEALRIGIVNKVTLPEQFMEEARNMARELSRRPAKAIEAIKRSSEIVPRLDKGAALEYVYEIGALLFSRPERKEHMRRFIEDLEKRKKR